MLVLSSVQHPIHTPGRQPHHAAVLLVGRLCPESEPKGFACGIGYGGIRRKAVSQPRSLVLNQTMDELMSPNNSPLVLKDVLPVFCQFSRSKATPCSVLPACRTVQSSGEVWKKRCTRCRFEPCMHRFNDPSRYITHLHFTSISHPSHMGRKNRIIRY